MPQVVLKNLNYAPKPKVTQKSDKELHNVKELLNVQQLIMLMVQRGFSIPNFATYELLTDPKALADADGFYKNLLHSRTRKYIFSIEWYSSIYCSCLNMLHSVNLLVLSMVMFFIFSQSRTFFELILYLIDMITWVSNIQNPHCEQNR